MNSMPLASSAARIFLSVSFRPPDSPSTDSSRAIVGSEMPECRARSDWDQPQQRMGRFDLSSAAVGSPRRHVPRSLTRYWWFLTLGGLRRRTPGPPPFSSMNSTPADSSACRSAATVEPCAAIRPGFDSSRLIVGSETDDACDRSRCSHRKRARAARISSLLSKKAGLPTWS